MCLRRPRGCGCFVSRNLFCSRWRRLRWFRLVLILRSVAALVFFAGAKKVRGEKSALARKARERKKRGAEKSTARREIHWRIKNNIL